MRKNLSMLIFVLILSLLDGITVEAFQIDSSHLNSFKTEIATFSSNEVIDQEGTLFYNWTPETFLIDDSCDWLESPETGLGTDIQKGYVACDGEFIYMLWTLQYGSHVDEFYFDVGSENGYAIGGIKADYLLTPFAGKYIYRWGGRDFLPLNLSFRWYDSVHGSEDGRIAYHGWRGMEPLEYLELKIALSVLGNPAVTKFVYKIKYAGQDQAPDGSFFLVFSNQTQIAVASFYTKPVSLQFMKTNAVAYFAGGGFNATIKILNYGDSKISPLNVTVNIPDDMNSSLNQKSWICSLSPKESWTSQFILKSQRLGKSNLAATISYEGSEDFRQTIPLTLLTIPNVTMDIHPEKLMRAGFNNDLNISLANHDTVPAEVLIDLEGQYTEYWLFQPVTIELGPNSSVKFLTEVVPLAIINPEQTELNRTFLRMAVWFENFKLRTTQRLVNVTQANVEISINSPKEFIAGHAFHVNVSAINHEEKEVKAALKVRAEVTTHWIVDVLKLDDEAYKILQTIIYPNSSITIPFKFKAISEYRRADILLSIRHGFNYDYRYVSVVILPREPISWPVVALIIIAVIAVVAVFSWTRKKKSLLPNKNKPHLKP